MLRTRLMSSFPVGRVAIMRSLPYVATFITIIVTTFLSFPEGTPITQISGYLATPTLLSILVFIILDRFSQNYEDAREMHEIRAGFNGVRELIQSSEHIVHIGPPTSAIHLIAISIRSASFVWNTYFQYGVLPGFNYGSDSKDEIIDAMRHMLERPETHWIDVISDIDDDFRKRINTLSDTITKRDCYRCYLIRENQPHLNFMVIDFNGASPTEVFFGFGRHPHDEVGHVFHSKSENIVEMFRRLHGSLRDKDIATKTQNPILKVDDDLISGTWRSVGFQRDQCFADIAYVTIKRTGNKAFFKGFIFSGEGNLTGWFETAEAVINSNKIIFLYYKVDSGQVTRDVKAVGMYDFGDERNFIGFLVSMEPNGSMLTLKGERASKEEEEAVANRDWQKAGKLAKEFTESAGLKQDCR